MTERALQSSLKMVPVVGQKRHQLRWNGLREAFLGGGTGVAGIPSKQCSCSGGGGVRYLNHQNGGMLAVNFLQVAHETSKGSPIASTCLILKE